MKMSQAFNDPSTLRPASTFILPPKTPEKCLYLDSDVWAVCFTVIFVGSFHYLKLVSCWILFCENVPSIPLPFNNQLSLCVGKRNTFKMRLYFDSDVRGRFLTIIFVLSFPYLKFLSEINSKVRRK